MNVKQKLFRVFQRVRQMPLKYLVGVGLLTLITLYTSLFILEKPLSFSYANASNCVQHSLLFPSIYTVKDSSGFVVRSAGEVKIGNITLASSVLCFEAAVTPKEGGTKVSIAPFNLPLFGKTFVVSVPPPVKVQAEALDKPISVSKPLALTLSGADSVFSYRVKVDEQEAPCSSESQNLKCDIQGLNLHQGKQYPLMLNRYFKGTNVATIAQKEVMTLSATTVKDTSVKGGETVFIKPKTVSFVLDKKAVKAEASLYVLREGQKSKQEVATTLTERGLDVAFVSELPRSTDYELVIDSIEAEDGSGLEDPYTVAFKTSGGPKVTGISVGKTGVPIGATAAISFDQPLLEGQDISKIVTLSGGAKLAGKKGNQIMVSLSGIGKCGNFGITINNDLQSNYEISGNSNWSFGGRVVCHTVGTIGYSSKGRPINAYYFGNGGRNIVFTGAIHGNEAGTKVLMDRWVQDLEANAPSIPADKSVIVVPTINPDGIASGARVNARNVDLNRNFATSDWRSDITDVNNRPFPGGGGPSPMSEPETNAIGSLISRLRPMAVLSYHSIGGVVAANQAGNSGSLASRYSQLSGYRNATGQTGDTFEYAVSGTADDWYAEKLGVASILVELSSHTSSQFERNQKAMWAMVNG